MSTIEISTLKQSIKQQFQSSFSNYMKYAYPHDELKPISCTGMSTWGNYSLTLIDSLDTLYIMNMMDEFKYSIELILNNTSTTINGNTIYGINFNKDTHVSVFESNIRILGGLLSAHLLAIKHDWYLLNYYKSSPITTQYGNTQNGNTQNGNTQNNLLTLAIDLANRLLPAFNTPTGIPYGMIHLQLGVLSNESNITSVAGGGTFLLEFGLLSYLTGDLTYYEIAKKATLSIYSKRDLKTNLVGNHINILNGEWIHRESGIGASIDSYYEYCYKSFLLFKDEQLLNSFKIQLNNGILKHVYKTPFYSDVDMKLPKITHGLFNSLGSFFPGLITIYGKYEHAKNSINALHGIFRKYGSIPEGFNLLNSKAQRGQLPYPLRPELIESIYHLFKFDGSRDSNYLYMARDFYWSLKVNMEVKCGYAVVENVESKQLGDRMESFFLAETLKYLYLIFDNENLVHFNQNKNGSGGNSKGSEELLYTFNTEAHLIPLNLNEYLNQYDPYYVKDRFKNDFSKRETIERE